MTHEEATIAMSGNTAIKVVVRSGRGQWDSASRVYSDGVETVTRVPRQKGDGWWTVNYRGKVYRVRGGVTTVFYIELGKAISGRYYWQKGDATP